MTLRKTLRKKRVMLLDERLVPTNSLFHGARRTEIAKVDKEMEPVEFAMNLALDTGDWDGAYQQQLKLNTLRAERQRLLDCSILEVPGGEG